MQKELAKLYLYMQFFTRKSICDLIKVQWFVAVFGCPFDPVCILASETDRSTSLSRAVDTLSLEGIFRVKEELKATGLCQLFFHKSPFFQIKTKCKGI